MRQELLHGEKQEGKRQTEWNETKKQQGETVECCKCCMLLHSRAKLMLWLPVISAFWYHLTCNAQPPTLMFFGYHSEAAATRVQPDMKTTKAGDCSWWIHWVLPEFQLLQLKMETGACGKATETCLLQNHHQNTAAQPWPELAHPGTTLKNIGLLSGLGCSSHSTTARGQN